MAGDLEAVRDRLHADYQQTLALRMRTEKRHLEVPRQELAIQITELGGYLRGVKAAIDQVEEQMAQPGLPFKSS